MNRVKDTAVNRQQGYVRHWEATSCPQLHAEDLVENYCSQSLSYEGLNLTLHCRNNKEPTAASVRCQKESGKLTWSSKPSCEYVWGPWSAWSTCSATCGEGQRSRTRQKPSGEIDTQTKQCEEQECCQRRDGKFRCRNERLKCRTVSPHLLRPAVAICDCVTPKPETSGIWKKRR
ncbi:SE-cephalotoxin [Penaeus vannamei]|uniref:SE-cephalotoxin n=1 Tax=Penaeus vannamei TaxID=6689 RepID=A0A423ST32_PENVA|nr:SE-cephalotoxin [Penaeus vannamei]